MVYADILDSHCYDKSVFVVSLSDVSWSDEGMVSLSGFTIAPAVSPPYVENVVFDVADLDTGVLCCWSVLEQWLEPANRRKGFRK